MSAWHTLKSLSDPSCNQLMDQELIEQVQAKLEFHQKQAKFYSGIISTLHTS